ncbi:hypothetical protein B484DRAFT_484747 [Ochromonadaceae sp. CCMP2298]|nr:hypothetical protein B484DRAFT_484747 [Ochromonadaceae sp. CCMP2298]
MGGGGEGGGGGGGEGVSSNGSNPYKGGDKRQRKVGAPVSASALVTVSASALVSASTSPSRSPSASVSSRCAKAARLTKARGGSIEDEEEQGVGEFAEFGGSGGGAIVKYEVVCKLAPLLPVPKNDIRRLIPAMFVNALNSASAAVILNYFSTFMQGCCTYDELNTSNRSLDLPTNINLTGPQRMTNYLLGLAVMMPDISFRLRYGREAIVSDNDVLTIMFLTIFLTSIDKTLSAGRPG